MAINDPTTAVQALDRIRHFLARIAFRSLEYTGAPKPAAQAGLLRGSVPAERRDAINKQLELLNACVGQNFADPRERDVARAADRLGFGGSP